MKSACTAILVLAVSALTFCSSFMGVRAVTPSYFYDYWQGCQWEGLTRLGSPVSQAYTFDNSGCLDYCFLYAQWLNSGGTYYTYYGSYQYCPSYAQYSNISQTELYGEHSVVKDFNYSSSRATDAIY